MHLSNRGVVRGGSNSHARLHVHVTHPDLSGNEEYAAAFAAWDDLFGPWPPVQGCHPVFPPTDSLGYWRQVDTRRQFAILPALVRKALAGGFDVQLSIYDRPEGLVCDRISLTDSPADFWREVALAQMFVSGK